MDDPPVAGAVGVRGDDELPLPQRNELSAGEPAGDRSTLVTLMARITLSTPVAQDAHQENERRGNRGTPS